MNYLRTADGYAMHHDAIYAELGVTNAQLPLGGLPSRTIGGVVVWVAARDPNSRRKPHRVLCLCPLEGCSWVGSVGRLQQHLHGHEPAKFKKGDQVEVKTGGKYYNGTILRRQVPLYKVQVEWHDRPLRLHESQIRKQGASWQVP